MPTRGQQEAFIRGPAARAATIWPAVALSVRQPHSAARDDRYIGAICEGEIGWIVIAGADYGCLVEHLGRERGVDACRCGQCVSDGS